tara:strand:+ start:2336 stop:3205 length:870 start_codon:yes stop_codon:yes gene_type:complete
MPTPTVTTQLDNSLATVIASARVTREQEGDMPALVERRQLKKGTGDTWHEVSYAKLTAMAVNETTENDNIQQVSDTDFAIKPTMVQIATMLTDKVGRNITKNGLREIGRLGQNAMQRKKNIDGLTAIDSTGSTQLGSAGSAMTYGLVAAAVTNITGNTTEPGHQPIRFVAHPFCMKDIYDQFTAPVGTYDISEGASFRVFREGFRGMINTAQAFENGDFDISSTDAKNGVFSKEGIVMVEEMSPRMETERMPRIGGGSTVVTHTDSYAYGIRQNQWVHEIIADATAPTS